MTTYFLPMGSINAYWISDPRTPARCSKSVGLSLRSGSDDGDAPLARGIASFDIGSYSPGASHAWFWEYIGQLP